MKKNIEKIRFLLLKKKFGSIGFLQIYRFCKKMFIYLMYLYIPASALAIVSNNVILKEERYAAILLSGYAFSNYDYWASPIAFLGSYPAWTLYFNLNGVKTDYFFNATKEDMKTALIDPKYESIVMVGHGSRNGWRATDIFVSNDDINEWKELFEPKKGEWFQLSCAGSDTYPEHIGELVMDNKNKVYYYSGDVAGTTMFITDAVTGFRLMKYQTQKRRLNNND